MQSDQYLLTLYIVRRRSNSVLALSRVREICETYLKNRYELKVVDVLQHPEIAEREQVMGVPTLIKESPPPRQRIVGDLSERDEVLRRLGIYHLSFTSPGEEERTDEEES